jgi:hypothetical protein
MARERGQPAIGWMVALIVIVTTLAVFGFIFYVLSGTDTASVAGNSGGVELNGGG